MELITRLAPFCVLLAWAVALPVHDEHGEGVSMLQAEDAQAPFGLSLSVDRQGIEDNLRINRWRKRIELLKEQAKQDQQRVVAAAMAIPSKEDELGEAGAAGAVVHRSKYVSGAVLSAQKEAATDAKDATSAQHQADAESRAKSAKLDAEVKSNKRKQVLAAEHEAQQAASKAHSAVVVAQSEAMAAANQVDKDAKTDKARHDELQAKIHGNTASTTHEKQQTKAQTSKPKRKVPRVLAGEVRAQRQAGDHATAAGLQQVHDQEAQANREATRKTLDAVARLKAFKQGKLHPSEAITDLRKAEADLEKAEAAKPAVEPKKAEAAKPAAETKVTNNDQTYTQHVTHVTNKMVGLLERIGKRNQASLATATHTRNVVRAVAHKLETQIPASFRMSVLIEESEGTEYTPSLGESEAAAAQESAENDRAALQSQAYEQARESDAAEQQAQTQSTNLSIEQQQAAALAQRREAEENAMRKEVLRVQAAYQRKVQNVQKEEKRKAMMQLQHFARDMKLELGETSNAHKPSAPAETKKAEATKPAAEPKKAEATKPAAEPKKAEAAKPAAEPKKAEASKPAAELKKAEAAKPAAESKKAEAPKPAAESKKAEAAKRAAESKKAEAPKRAAESKKAEAAKPAAESKKTDAAKPAVEPKKAEAAKPAAESKKAEVSSKQENEIKHTALSPGDKVKKEQEAENRYQKAQEAAIVEAGVQRALVDTMKKIKKLDLDTRKNIKGMETMYRHDRTTVVKAATLREKKKLNLKNLEKKEKQALSNLKGERHRLKVTTGDELHAVEELSKMSKTADNQIAAFKKTLSLVKRLSSVASDVAHRVQERSARLGESNAQLDIAAHAGLKLLQNAAKTEIQNVQKSKEAENMIRKQLTQVTKILKAAAPNKKEPAKQLLDVEELIDLTEPKKPAQPKSALDKERQALVKAQSEFDQLRISRHSAIRDEEAKLKAEQRKAVATAKLRVKRSADKERALLDHDIQETTKVDVSLAHDVKSIQKAVQGLHGVESHLNTVIAAQKAAQASAQKNVKSLKAFLSEASKVF